MTCADANVWSFVAGAAFGVLATIGVIAGGIVWAYTKGVRGW